MDKEANDSKVQYLLGNVDVYMAGISVKVQVHYLGRSLMLLPKWRIIMIVR